MDGIEFKKRTEEPLLSYQILDQDKNEIGSTEGFVNDWIKRFDLCQ